MTLLEIVGIVFSLVVIAALVSPGRALPFFSRVLSPVTGFLSEKFFNRGGDTPDALIFSPADDVEMAASYYPDKHREDYGEKYKSGQDTDITEGEREYFENVTDLDQWAGYREKPVFQKYREDLTWLWISPNTEAARKSPVFFSYFLFPWRTDAAIDEWEKELKTTKGKKVHRVIHKNLGVTYLFEENFTKAFEHFKAYQKAGVESWWEREPLERLISRLTDDAGGEG